MTFQSIINRKIINDNEEFRFSKLMQNSKWVMELVELINKFRTKYIQYLSGQVGGASDYSINMELLHALSTLISIYLKDKYDEWRLKGKIKFAFKNEIKYNKDVIYNNPKSFFNSKTEELERLLRDANLKFLNKNLQEFIPTFLMETKHVKERKITNEIVQGTYSHYLKDMNYILIEL